VPLRGVAVQSTVLPGEAHVVVRQRYYNTEPVAIEAVYTFPLPADATLTGFAMTCQGQRLQAEVREREAAFHAYDDAMAQGHGAALLEQERADVFTASIGNLLPGEETVIEIEYMQRLHAEEGALRWMLPIVVAPRYIPGIVQGDRTGDGRSAPTDQVPDADRISPRIGAADYILTLDLTFDLGVAVAVESPSHALQVRTEGTRTYITLAGADVRLDRDVVVLARGVRDAPLVGVVAHREGTAEGWFALGIVPDLQGEMAKTAPQTVVFVLDRSGSMDGSAMLEARAALRLCLRQLRAGDRFQILAFDDRVETFARTAVAYDQSALERADAWLHDIEARGGTEMLTPLCQAMAMAAGGIVVLLTDGQVGNEEAIADAALAAGPGARIYAFGIGSAVSDGLMRDLARRSKGAVAFIHPGERIDDKVVAMFAQATAPRVTQVAVRYNGVTVSELAPADPPPLVDGEPWLVTGRYALHASDGGEISGEPATGSVEITGLLHGQPFRLDVPLTLPTQSEHPVLPRLWAARRIADLLAAPLEGRRASANRQRVIALAVAHGVASPWTAFVVVEQREGERRTSQTAQTRFVPVNAPAGWAMLQARPQQHDTGVFAAMSGPAMSMPCAPAPPSAMPSAPLRSRRASPKMSGPPQGFVARGLSALFGATDGAPVPPPPPPPGQEPAQLLQQQRASGLWDDPALGQVGAQREVRATAAALLLLSAAGITTAHPLYGAQIKKAIQALLVALHAGVPSSLVELALAAAWLAASGGRTRQAIGVQVAGEAPVLQAMLLDDAVLRAHAARIDQ
jgi:Ca-activated chloride channel family protein